MFSTLTCEDFLKLHEMSDHRNRSNPYVDSCSDGIFGDPHLSPVVIRKLISWYYCESNICKQWLTTGRTRVVVVFAHAEQLCFVGEKK